MSESQLIHLYNLIHACQQPDLQYKLVGKFEEALFNAGIESPNTLDCKMEVERGKRKEKYDLSKEGVNYNVNFCICCRRMLIPGINVRIRIKYGRQGRRGRRKGKGSEQTAQGGTQKGTQRGPEKDTEMVTQTSTAQTTAQSTAQSTATTQSTPTIQPPYLTYSCLGCGTRVKFDVLRKKGQIQTSKGEAEDASSRVNHRGKKRKKRRDHGLGDLLERKRKKEEGVKQLDLFDFMK